MRPLRALALLVAACGSAAAAPPALSELAGLSGQPLARVAAPAARPVRPAAPVVEEILGFRVRGDAAFRMSTRAALLILRRSREFDAIRRTLAEIRESPRSGADLPAAVFDASATVASGDPLWYAGDIAHDAYHIMLWQGREDGPATGEKGEKLCLAYQIGVLKELGAPKPMLDYLARLKKHPRYQDHDRTY